ncbi:hypothetical protein QTP70_007877 [Hemibagrus guttatus]|uniref:Uncharacterized protein n=1 Tax=Hemibagrus guttatus TaxID=175788 RepID=A0AAE0V2J9_9TELE|nr:hypothetical protein QTP70_007877 [Hemibagrus guttatus]
MLYGLETVSLRKRQESELEVAALKMLRSSPEPGPKSRVPCGYGMSTLTNHFVTVKHYMAKDSRSSGKVIY